VSVHSVIKCGKVWSLLIEATAANRHDTASTRGTTEIETFFLFNDFDVGCRHRYCAPLGCSSSDYGKQFCDDVFDIGAIAAYYDWNIAGRDSQPHGLAQQSIEPARHVLDDVGEIEGGV